MTCVNGCRTSWVHSMGTEPQYMGHQLYQVSYTVWLPRLKAIVLCVTVLLMSKGTTFLEIGQVLSEYTSEGSRETGCMFTPLCSSTTVSDCNYKCFIQLWKNFFSLPLILSIVFVIVLSKSCSRGSLIRKTRGLSLLHIVKISLMLSHNIDL